MSSHPQYTALPPLPNPPTPLLTRITYHVRLLLIKYISSLLFSLYRLLKPLPRSERPTITKSYPKHPHLVHRIFYPPTYRPDTKALLPLYIDIHGGGFALGDPSYDDTVNSQIARLQNCIVISLDYSKSPSVRFPVPTRELVYVVQCILSDVSLSYDRNRVIIAGQSAGGNLALSVAQHSSLRGKILGLIAYYPVVDFSTKTAEKALLRPYVTTEEVDTLSRGGMSKLFNYGYIAEGEDLRDPLLSPLFVKDRKNLPPWLLFVAAEYDMLSHEAGVLAGTLAGIDIASQWGTPTSDRKFTNEGPQKFGFEIKEEATGGNAGKVVSGGIKWINVKGAKHGFTHWMGDRGAVEDERSELAGRVAVEVGKWIARGPFSGRGSGGYVWTEPEDD